MFGLYGNTIGIHGLRPDNEVGLLRQRGSAHVGLQHEMGVSIGLVAFLRDANIGLKDGQAQCVSLFYGLTDLRHAPITVAERGQQQGTKDQTHPTSRSQCGLCRMGHERRHHRTTRNQQKGDAMYACDIRNLNEGGDVPLRHAQIPGENPGIEIIE
jgi:hypothetical protein